MPLYTLIHVLFSQSCTYRDKAMCEFGVCVGPSTVGYMPGYLIITVLVYRDKAIYGFGSCQGTFRTVLTGTRPCTIGQVPGYLIITVLVHRDKVMYGLGSCKSTLRTVLTSVFVFRPVG